MDKNVMHQTIGSSNSICKLTNDDANSCVTICKELTTCAKTNEQKPITPTKLETSVHHSFKEPTEYFIFWN
jgi:hypothetical protein